MLSHIRSLRFPSFLIACGLALAGPAALNLATAGPTPYPGVPSKLSNVTQIASPAAFSLTTKAGSNGVTAVAATGSMQFAAKSSYSDNQKDTISDQGGSFKAEYQLTNGFVPTATWTTVDLRTATTAEDVLQAWLGVVNGITHLAPVTPGAGLITFTNDTASTAGNIAITGTSPTVRVGMSGGVNAVANGNGGDVTIAPGAAGTGGAGGTAGKVRITRTLTVDGASTLTGAVAAPGGITGNLTGNADTATSATNATNFSGSLSGDVTGTQGATSISGLSGSKLSAASVPSSALVNTAVVSASYGSATQIGGFTVNPQGQITGAINTTIALAASQIASGQISAARGGTGSDTSGATGRPKITAGSWSTAAIDLSSEVTGNLPAGNIASNAITAAAISPTSFRYLGALGLAAAGAVTLTGAKVGDSVIGVVDNVGASVSADFETTISVNNQIQQTAGVLTAHALSVLLVAKGG